MTKTIPGIFFTVSGCLPLDPDDPDSLLAAGEVMRVLKRKGDPTPEQIAAALDKLIDLSIQQKPMQRYTPRQPLAAREPAGEPPSDFAPNFDETTQPPAAAE